MSLISRPSEWKYLNGTCHDYGHTWQPSCVYTAAEIFARVYWGGFKIYAPLYLVCVILSYGRARCSGVWVECQYFAAVV